MPVSADSQNKQEGHLIRGAWGYVTHGEEPEQLILPAVYLGQVQEAIEPGKTHAFLVYGQIVYTSDTEGFIPVGHHRFASLAGHQAIQQQPDLLKNLSLSSLFNPKQWGVNPLEDTPATINPGELEAGDLVIWKSSDNIYRLGRVLDNHRRGVTTVTVESKDGLLRHPTLEWVHIVAGVRP